MATLQKNLWDFVFQDGSQQTGLALFGKDLQRIGCQIDEPLYLGILSSLSIPCLLETFRQGFDYRPDEGTVKFNNIILFLPFDRCFRIPHFHSRLLDQHGHILVSSPQVGGFVLPITHQSVSTSSFDVPSPFLTDGVWTMVHSSAGFLDLYISQLEGLKQQIKGSLEAQTAGMEASSDCASGLEQPLLGNPTTSFRRHPTHWMQHASSRSRRTTYRQGRLRRLLATAQEREKQLLVRSKRLYWRLRVSVSCNYQNLPQ
jgi:hypothetical protein